MVNEAGSHRRGGGWIPKSTKDFVFAIFFILTGNSAVIRVLKGIRINNP